MGAPGACGPCAPCAACAFPKGTVILVPSFVIRRIYHAHASSGHSRTKACCPVHPPSCRLWPRTAGPSRPPSRRCCRQALPLTWLSSQPGTPLAVRCCVLRLRVQQLGQSVLCHAAPSVSRKLAAQPARPQSCMPPALSDPQLPCCRCPIRSTLSATRPSPLCPAWSGCSTHPAGQARRWAVLRWVPCHANEPVSELRAVSPHARGTQGLDSVNVDHQSAIKPLQATPRAWRA